MSTDENTSVLQVSNLTKIYGREIRLSSHKIGRCVEAVSDVSFSVKKGEILGFLDPNEAVKTTTIRSILGYLNIQSGEIKINGQDYLKEAFEINKIILY